MVTKLNKNAARIKRHYRVRNKIGGTPERPRLNVFRSSKHIYAQIIDDETGVTIAATSTIEKGFEPYGGNKEAAHEIGKLVAQRATEKGVTSVVFDRSGYLYHGRVKELAEGAREGGLQF